jgi:hypothetical protein
MMVKGKLWNVLFAEVGTFISDLISKEHYCCIVACSRVAEVLQSSKFFSWLRQSFESGDDCSILLSLYERVDLRTPEICLLFFWCTTKKLMYHKFGMVV